MYFQGFLRGSVLAHTLTKPILVRQTHKQCGKKTCINSTQSYDKKYCSECQNSVAHILKSIFLDFRC